MKKQLLTTTALVAAGIVAAAGAAQAQKMKKPYITVNGYHEQVIGGVISQDDIADPNAFGVAGAPTIDTSYLDVNQETEVHFNGHVKLDNGITMLAHWELETNTNQRNSGNTITPLGIDVLDEVYLIIRGSFGQLTIGSEDNAASLMLTGYSGSWPTGVGQNLAFDGCEWVVCVSADFDTVRDSRLTGQDSDAEKISYFTPRFAGFQIGVSYIPGSRLYEEDQGGRGQQTANTDYHDGVALAFNYTGKIGGVGIGGGAGYLHMQAPEAGLLGVGPFPGGPLTGPTAGGPTAAGSVTKDMKAMAVAARFDFGAIRISGAWKRTASNQTPGGAGTTLDRRGRVIDLGARFTAGPNMFSIVGSHGKYQTTSQEQLNIIAGYQRILGPGVRWAVNIFYSDSTNAAGTVTNDGFAASTGVRITF